MLKTDAPGDIGVSGSTGGAGGAGGKGGGVPSGTGGGGRGGAPPCGPDGCDPDEDAGEDLPCLTPADCDDLQACTHDALAGAVGNCSTACTNTPITEALNNDTCCPSGQTAATDSDCAPVCGNDVIDPGEDCDGGPGCVNCTLADTQDDCIARLSMPGSASEACRRCACTVCTTESFECLDDSDATRRMKCDAVITCALANDCVGIYCYCGNSDPSCFYTNGKCEPEMEAAAGSTLTTTINSRRNDKNFAIGRAVALSECAEQKCPNVCPQR